MAILVAVNSYSAVRALFRRNAAEEGKVSSSSKRRAMQVGRNAMVDRCNKVCVWQGLTLRIANRDHGTIFELLKDWNQFLEVEPPVQSGNARGRHQARKRECPVIDMAMNDVEIVGILVNFAQHRHVVTQSVGCHLRKARASANSLPHPNTRKNGASRRPRLHRRRALRYPHRSRLLPLRRPLSPAWRAKSRTASIR